MYALMLKSLVINAWFIWVTLFRANIYGKRYKESLERED